MPFSLLSLFYACSWMNFAFHFCFWKHCFSAGCRDHMSLCASGTRLHLLMEIQACLRHRKHLNLKVKTEIQNQQLNPEQSFLRCDWPFSCYPIKNMEELRINVWPIWYILLFLMRQRWSESEDPCSDAASQFFIVNVSCMLGCLPFLVAMKTDLLTPLNITEIVQKY